MLFQNIRDVKNNWKDQVFRKTENYCKSFEMLLILVHTLKVWSDISQPASSVTLHLGPLVNQLVKIISRNQINYLHINITMAAMSSC